MSIFDAVTDQMKDAMRAKEAIRLGALRGIRAAFLTELKRDGSERLGDEVCTAILRRLEKQRKESIEAFEGGGREEMAANERAELAVIQEFLPSLADEAQTRGWVEEAICEGMDIQVEGHIINSILTTPELHDEDRTFHRHVDGLR